MKRLKLTILSGILCFAMGVSGQYNVDPPSQPNGGPGSGPSDGPGRPTRPPLPRPIRDNPAFQDFVNDFQAFRADFKSKMQDYRRQMADATEAEKAAIRREREQWLKNYRAQQSEWRKQVRRHLQAARKARDAATGD